MQCVQIVLQERLIQFKFKMTRSSQGAIVGQAKFLAEANVEFQWHEDSPIGEIEGSTGFE